MRAEFYSLGMILLQHAAQAGPGRERALSVQLFINLAWEENQ